MVRVVEWSTEAENDLDELAEYIARTSPKNADSVVREILAAARNLPTFPYAGRIVPEWHNSDRRETFVHRWRLMYRVLPDRVRVVGVIHGARLLSNVQSRSFEHGPQAEYVAS